MMLFVVKYLHTDIANAVYELSKANDKANYMHYKQMLCAVKYVINTKIRMLKFIPDKKIEKQVFRCTCNCDYTWDKDNQLSLTRNCIYVNGCLV